MLTARRLEGGLHFGLGSTMLSMTRTALAKAGGLEPLTDYLADDYEIGGADCPGGVSGGALPRGGRNDGAGIWVERVLEPPDAVGAVYAGLAEMGVFGAGDYLCAAVGVGDDGGEWVCALELFAC